MVVLAFLTHVISGHSNVHFAIFRRLLSLPAGEAPSNIYILSDEPLRKRVASLPRSAHTAVTFCAIDDTDVLGSVASTFRGPPLSFFTPAGRRVLREHIVPATFLRPEVYLRRYSRIMAVLQEIKPDLVIVDLLLGTPGFDACTKLRLRYVIEAPVASLDVVRASQPRGRGFWKYPMMFMPTQHPIPLFTIPFNILNTLLFVLVLVLHPAHRRLNAVRKQLGHSRPALPFPIEDAQFSLYPSLPELDYPHVPAPRTVFAGPILTNVPALSPTDSRDIWDLLARGRTVLVNMGTLFRYTAKDVVAMADALADARLRLRRRGGLQVLWKLPRAPVFAALLEEVLGHAEEWQEWLRVEEWIEPPTLAVLQHPNLKVFIHHGGANSVHEAAYAGVPQVILPQWLDLYTFASRVEALGHGIYANRGAEALIDARQLADALVRVCTNGPGEPGASICARAEELGRVCQAAKGDERAAGAILAAARGEKLDGVYY